MRTSSDDFFDMNEPEVCGTCKWHKPDEYDDEYDQTDWTCDNPDSDNYGDWTTYGTSCEFWESRK